MNTQQYLNLQTAIDVAEEVGLDCTINADDEGIVIVMDTGEIETAAGLPRAIEIIRAYGALN